MHTRQTPILIALVAVALFGPSTLVADEAAQVVEQQDGRYIRLSLKGDPKAQGWLYEIWDDDEEEEEEDAGAELIVALHGAGGDPRNFLLPRLMSSRTAYCLAVAGRREVPHATGRGFMWSGADVDYILALTRHVIKTRNVDKTRVLIWGHSAGGTMTITALAKAPALFAGALTTAAGMAPGKPHEDKRVFVILGEDDPNYRVAPLVRKHVKRTEKTKGACALLSVEWLEHVLPADDFLDFGFDWVIHGKGRGGEASVGLIAKGRSGPWRHILLRHKDAENKEEPSERKKKDAVKLLEEVLSAVKSGSAFFPFEAARLSEDGRSKSAGGGLSEARLETFFGKVPSLKAGTCSTVLESTEGVHLVQREIEEDE